MPPVIVQDYDPSWPLYFEQLRSTIVRGLGSIAVKIEHIGSTAVPGLPAKPIIDIDVVVAGPSDIPAAIERLSSLGYVHEGDLGIAGREAFIPPARSLPHHLYLCTVDADELQWHLQLRDYLRRNAGAAHEYGALKKRLALECREDRGAYTRGKGEFVRRLLQEAQGS